jgi:hypothetical protein
MGKTLRWVIPGSRLLATDRAAILKSGSPPGRWAYDQPVFIKRTITKRRTLLAPRFQLLAPSFSPR